MVSSRNKAGQTVGAAPVKHLRITCGKKDSYICNQACRMTPEKWTWQTELVTCKKCLNQLAKHPFYMQKIRYYIVDEIKPRYSVVNLLKIKDWFIRNHRVSLSDNELDKFFEVIKNKKKVEAILNDS